MAYASAGLGAAPRNAGSMGNMGNMGNMPSGGGYGYSPGHPAMLRPETSLVKLPDSWTHGSCCQTKKRGAEDPCSRRNSTLKRWSKSPQCETACVNAHATQTQAFRSPVGPERRHVRGLSAKAKQCLAPAC